MTENEMDGWMDSIDMSLSIAGETYSFSSPFIPHMTIPLRLMMVTQKAEEAKILFLIIFAVF